MGPLSLSWLPEERSSCPSSHIDKWETGLVVDCKSLNRFKLYTQRVKYVTIINTATDAITAITTMIAAAAAAAITITITIITTAVTTILIISICTPLSR